MNKNRLMLSAVLTASLVASVSAAAEFPIDHTIVVSDDWCAPNNDGACNKCNSGHLVRTARCTGSYCDNMIYGCWAPPVILGNPVSMTGTPFPTITVSEWQGEWSQDAMCPPGSAQVGAYASYPYSLYVGSWCQNVYRSTWSDITLVISRFDPISDEYPLNKTVFPDLWLNGAACSGANCDNMFYWYTKKI